MSDLWEDCVKYIVDSMVEHKLSTYDNSQKSGDVGTMDLPFVPSGRSRPKQTACNNKNNKNK